MVSTTLWNPEAYAKNARFVSNLGGPLLELLDPRPGETILDLGCGDGVLTEKIAAAGCVALGADTSLDQIQAAQKRDLRAVVMDGQQLSLKQRFDAVFSNAALHWMQRAQNVVEGVASCLKPGGRFVGEFGGKGNVEKIRAALHQGLHRRAIDPWTVDPWYYASPQEYSKLLAASGFQVAYIELIPRLTQLPGDLFGWLEVFAQPFTKAVSAEDRAAFLREVRTQLEPDLRQSDGSWCADYVRLRFKAVKQT
jgi:trans-aconitate methyltransferase